MENTQKSSDDVNSSNGRDWKDLDRDVLISIYQRLSHKDLVKGAPLCCTSWYSASKDPCLWEVVNLRYWEPSDDWWKETQPVNEILDFVINRSQGLLTEIDFPLRSSVDDLLYVAERCPRLMYIDLNICQSKVKLEEAKKTFGLSLGRLKELGGMGVDEVFISDDSTLQKINQCCPNFNQLKVYLHEEDDFLLKNTVFLITTYFPKLKELDLSGTELDRQDVLLILEACDELEFLDITCNGKICVKDDILKIGSRLKEFYWDNEVQDVCCDCEREYLEGIEETYSYRWPCPHVVEEGFEAYISGTEEFLSNLYPNSGGTFTELVGSLYPDAKGSFLYPSSPFNPSPLFDPFLLDDDGPLSPFNPPPLFDPFLIYDDDDEDEAYIEYCYAIE